jgi:hypothetical protein
VASSLDAEVLYIDYVHDSDPIQTETSCRPDSTSVTLQSQPNGLLTNQKPWHNKPGQAPQCSPYGRMATCSVQASSAPVLPASVLRNRALFLHICGRESFTYWRMLKRNHLMLTVHKQDHRDTSKVGVPSLMDVRSHHLACGGWPGKAHTSQSWASPIAISNLLSPSHAHRRRDNQSTTGPR